MMLVEVNFLAVVVAAVVGMIIGALWYSPILFGNIWMRLIGINPKDIDKAKAKGMGKSYALAFLSVLIMSYILAILVYYVDARSIGAGIMTGFWIWLGFFATSMTSMVLWEGKPVKLYWLNTLHYLVVLAVMGAIHAVWQ